MPGFDKDSVLTELRRRIEERLESLHASQRATQSGATHEETRQEHPKDTRAIEATYLARGLAERVEALGAGAALLRSLEIRRFGPDDAVALTALIGLEDRAGEAQICFLVPFAGGETLELGEHSVRCLTPGSPLGRALIGRRVDDEVEIDLPGGRETLSIEWIR